MIKVVVITVAVVVAALLLAVTFGAVVDTLFVTYHADPNDDADDD